MNTHSAESIEHSEERTESRAGRRIQMIADCGLKKRSAEGIGQSVEKTGVMAGKRNR